MAHLDKWAADVNVAAQLGRAAPARVLRAYAVLAGNLTHRLDLAVCWRLADQAARLGRDDRAGYVVSVLPPLIASRVLHALRDGQP